MYYKDIKIIKSKHITHFFLNQDNEIQDNPDVASVEFALMVQREAIRQIQRWFFEDTAHYFHSHITNEIIVSSLFLPSLFITVFEFFMNDVFALTKKSFDGLQC